jgi:hypothetical protein
MLDVLPNPGHKHAGLAHESAALVASGEGDSKIHYTGQLFVKRVAISEVAGYP